MTPVVATCMGAHLDRLAYAYFHSSTHPSDNLNAFHLRQAAERHGLNVVAFQQLDDQVTT